MLISKVGRKNPIIRLAFAAVYLLLAAGAVIIIYPFVLMTTSSMTTIEYDRFYPLPVFLWDDSALLGKYLHDKYEGPSSDIANMGAAYGLPINSTADLKSAMLEGDLFKDVYAGMKPSDPRWLEPAQRKVADWQDFKRTLPRELCGVYFSSDSLASSSKVKTGFLRFLRRKYARQIERRYNGDLQKFAAERGFRIKSFDSLKDNDRVIADEISRTYHIYVPSLPELRLPREDLQSHAWVPEDAPSMVDWLDYKELLTPKYVQPFCLSKMYQDYIARKYTLSSFDLLYGRQIASFRQLTFSPRRLASGGEISDWGEFIKAADDLSALVLEVTPMVQLLYEKMLQQQFETIADYNAIFSTSKRAFFELQPDPRQPQDPEQRAIWVSFLKDFVPSHLVVPLPDRHYHEEAIKKVYIAELKKKYLTLDNLNQEKGTSFRSFPQAYDSQEALPLFIDRLIAQYGTLNEFNRINRSTWKTWSEVRLPNPSRDAWRRFLIKKYGEISLLNVGHRRDYASFYEIPLPPVLADHDIVEFVKTSLPHSLISIEETQENRRLWYAYLSDRFNGSVESLSLALGKEYITFEELPFYYALPRNKKIRPLWIDFIEKSLPYESIRIRDPEDYFRAYLRGKYGTIGRLNEEYAATYASFDSVRPPYKETDLLEFHENKASIRMRFLVRNLAAVVKLITLRTRSLLNTLVLCSLSVLGALVINPLAAYALSRYRFRFAGSLQFFLVATAAFPSALTMIPNFLLLKKIGLLNTYWAVILPTMGSGLAIMIIKSFFDRLPQELFDAASLDGAGELRTFAHVCLPLSKPVLAVSALQVFLFTYGRFMWPLLTCQKERMWPLTVWLYQFHMRDAAAFPEIAMAALLIIAIPLVLVFIFCQRFIINATALPRFR